jgi:adenosine deaminase
MEAGGMTSKPLDVAGIEKAELHCHIDGLLDPTMLDELLADGHDFGLSAAALRSRYPFASLEAWRRDYCEFIEPHLGPREERLPLLLERHLRRLKAQRVVYAEIFVSGLLFPRGDDLGALIALFRELRRRADRVAKPELQVELVVCVGRGPPEKLERQLPRILALHREGLVCGVALAGAEDRFPVRPLRSCFERFHDSGMGIEIHAGELGGPDSVRDALEFGVPDRLGHGIALFQDPELIDLVRERRIHLELCPSSNLRLGVVPRIEDHPLGRAAELGLSFSINTDDPGPFACSMNSEFELARDTFHFDEKCFATILQSAKSAAFGATI